MNNFKVAAYVKSWQIISHTFPGVHTGVILVLVRGYYF